MYQRKKKFNLIRINKKNNRKLILNHKYNLLNNKIQFNKQILFKKRRLQNNKIMVNLLIQKQKTVQNKIIIMIKIKFLEMLKIKYRSKQSKINNKIIKQNYKDLKVMTYNNKNKKFNFLNKNKTRN